jgi:hypothetical protein
MLVVGHRADNTHENYFGIQVDANGELEWARIYMEPIGSYDGYQGRPTVEPVPTGGYQLTLPVGDGMHTVRLAADGSLLWHRRYRSAEFFNDYAPSDLAIDADGSMLLASTSYQYLTDSLGGTIVTARPELVRTDAQGVPLWARSIEGTVLETVFKLAQVEGEAFGPWRS